ncbi:unnamed protein product [Natator depressus]
MPHSSLWSHAEMLDFNALWGEECDQAPLNGSHLAQVYKQLSQQMPDRSTTRTLQCRSKAKKLQLGYRTTKYYKTCGKPSTVPADNMFAGKHITPPQHVVDSMIDPPNQNLINLVNPRADTIMVIPETQPDDQPEP